MAPDVSIIGVALSVLIGVSLGFFGGGGSILTVPLLVYVFHLEPKVAIASSLLVVGIASATAAGQHGYRGNVRPREGLIFGVAGMTGAYLGGRVGEFLDGSLLLLLFASLMLLTALAMWRGRRTVAVRGGSHAPIKLMRQGLTVGSFTGLVGAGGGFLIVPALALWAGLPMAAAVGTSLLVISLNCAAGFLGYVSHVQVDYALVAVVAAAAVGGSFAGSRLAHAVSPASLRRAFAGFVLVMAGLILAREGRLVAEMAGTALPSTLPQLVFATLLLVLGVLAGRASRGVGGPLAERPYEGGAGI